MNRMKVLHCSVQLHDFFMTCSKPIYKSCLFANVYPSTMNNYKITTYGQYALKKKKSHYIAVCSEFFLLHCSVFRITIYGRVQLSD